MNKKINLNYDEILARANELYFIAKTDGMTDREIIYADEEDINIKSDQVKSILKALIEAINNSQYRPAGLGPL